MREDGGWAGAGAAERVSLPGNQERSSALPNTLTLVDLGKPDGAGLPLCFGLWVSFNIQVLLFFYQGQR